jgi:hypothetical protein
VKVVGGGVGGVGRHRDGADAHHRDVGDQPLRAVFRHQHHPVTGADLRRGGFELIEPGKVLACVELTGGQLRDRQECRLRLENAALAEEGCYSMLGTFQLGGGLPGAYRVHACIDERGDGCFV